MAFSNKFMNSLCMEVYYNDYLNIYKETVTKLRNCVFNLAKRKGLFSYEDVKIYMQGSFLNNVHAREDTKLEIVVELKKTNEENFAEIAYNKMNIIKKRIVKYKPIYAIDEFRRQLFVHMLDEFTDRKVELGNRAITILRNRNNPLTIDVLPAFSFKKYDEEIKQEIPAILIYECYTDSFTLAFPQQHTENLNKKDEETNGNFRKTVRAFKRLRDVLIEEGILVKGFAPGYFIDCLLYNVPSNLYLEKDMNDCFVKIFNFLKHANISNFLCIHRQFSMFNNGYDSWVIGRARRFIDALIYAYLNIKE